MKKSKVYTKTGDTGQTALVSGNRTAKSDIRIDLYGELDELNSRIGLAASHLMANDYSTLVDFLYIIQSAIFDLGSNMACEVENRAQYKLPQLSSEFIEKIESEIDRMDGELSALKNFILPGGSVASSCLHLCRTNARSVERKSIHYHETTQEVLPAHTLTFLNRLSDYFFVFARYVNHLQKTEEIPWKPRN